MATCLARRSAIDGSRRAIGCAAPLASPRREAQQCRLITHITCHRELLIGQAVGLEERKASCKSGCGSVRVRKRAAYSCARSMAPANRTFITTTRSKGRRMLKQSLMIRVARVLLDSDPL